MNSFAQSEVRRHRGVPTIFVEGKPLHGMTATSVSFSKPEVIRDLTAAGAEIMMIWIEAGIHCWKGPGQYDWSYAEKKLQLFEENSGDTKWIIRVRLGLLARWWAYAHPAEVHNPPGAEAGKPDSTLSICNLVSPVWREEVCGMLSAFVTWLKGTRWAARIIGFMLNAGSSEEWLIFDTGETTQGRYQAAYTREFRLWLRRHYQDDEDALRKSWTGVEATNFLHQQSRPNDKTLSFENASCPSGHIRKGSHIWGPYSLRDPKEDQAAIDYYRFLNETLADQFIAVCRTVKETAATPIICGGFHSYLWWETGVYSYVQEYGHGLIQRVKASPWVDFVSDITSYDCRYPGGPSNYLGLPQSLQLSDKLHYTEVDLVTVSNLPAAARDAWKRADTSQIPPRVSEPVVANRLWNWSNGYCGRDEEEQVALFQREHFHNLITGTPYWWFDIRQMNYHEPWIVATLKKLSDIGKAAMEWDRGSLAEVAFVCSEETPLYQAAMNGEVVRFELESYHTLLLDVCTRKWGVAGIPFDVYELNDLAHKDFPGDQYKLLIFVNCAVVTPQAAAGIKRWQNAGRTHCWTHAPAVYHNRVIDPAKGEAIVGLRVGWRNQRQNVHVLVDDAGHPLTEGAAALNFGTEGSVGPVFFADDPQARVLGHLRDGGEAAFAVREHEDWRSVYLSMLNFGPSLFRNMARYAGAHVWSDDDDVVYANRSMVCLHTATPGTKRLRLPSPAMVTDLWTGERSTKPVETIEVDLPHYRTRTWRTEYV